MTKRWMRLIQAVADCLGLMSGILAGLSIGDAMKHRRDWTFPLWTLGFCVVMVTIAIVAGCRADRMPYDR